MKDDRGLSAGIAAAACIAVAATCAALAALGVVREVLPPSDVAPRSAVVAMAEPSATPEIVLRTREQRPVAAGSSPARTAGEKPRPRPSARRPRPPVPPPGTAAVPAPASVPVPEPAAPEADDGRRRPLRTLARRLAATTDAAGETVAHHNRPVGRLVAEAGQTVAAALDVALPRP